MSKGERERIDNWPTWRLIVWLADVERDVGADSSTARIAARLLLERLRAEIEPAPPPPLPADVFAPARRLIEVVEERYEGLEIVALVPGDLRAAVDALKAAINPPGDRPA